MLHAFSPRAHAELLTLRGSEVLLAFDFDGTLAPIVPHPERAAMSKGLSGALKALSSTFRIAVLTGRSIADVTSRLDFRPHYVAGNHGLEGLPRYDALKRNVRGQCRLWASALTRWINSGQAPGGVVVEDKGLSISIHYRFARDRNAACVAINAMSSTLQPRPRVMGGHCVVNLLSTDSPDKAAALTDIVDESGCGTVIYVGDDETDETVFRAARGSWFTIRVGYHPQSAARYFLNHQSEVAVFLARFAEAVMARPGATGLSGAGRAR